MDMTNSLTKAASGLLVALALATGAGAAPGKLDGSTITTPDGVQLYFKDWGPKDGPVVTFSHGWPLSSDSFESQMIFLADKGYRVVAHDRRGHGRSSQPWTGNDMNHYADDLATVIETLDLKNVTLVGFSTGGGEVARYIGRHGTSRVKKAVLIGAVTPLMLKTPDNATGTPIEVYDGIRKGAIHNRAQQYFDIASTVFFGFNRPGAKVSEGLVHSFVAQGLQAGHKNTFDSIKAFSETYFRPDLAKFDVPTLILHGDDDQLVSVDNNARQSHKLIKGSQLILYKNGPHGITDTHKDQLNQDLLTFLRN
jgi:non-heme chloroperoxidase